MGMCVAWVTGATVVLARKFSTTSFWDECRSNNVTVIQYIGEICRYLLNAPVSPLDKVHTIRMAHGNGMRPDVWNRFRDRFGIPLIGEWYASTEGTGILTNYNTGPNGAGAIGYRGTLARTVDKGLKIAKFDIQTEELIRDKNGRCIECAADEPGELLTMIDSSDPTRAFQGYHKNASANSKKVVTDAFKVGDQYFRTGDILRLVFLAICLKMVVILCASLCHDIQPSCLFFFLNPGAIRMDTFISAIVLETLSVGSLRTCPRPRSLKCCRLTPTASR